MCTILHQKEFTRGHDRHREYQVIRVSKRQLNKIIDSALTNQAPEYAFQRSVALLSCGQI